MSDAQAKIQTKIPKPKTSTDELHYLFLSISKAFLRVCAWISSVFMFFLGLIRLFTVVVVTIYIELFLGIIKTLFFPELMKTHHTLPAQEAKSMTPSIQPASEKGGFVFPHDYEVTPVHLSRHDINMSYAQSFSEILDILTEAENNWSFYIDCNRLDTVSKELKKEKNDKGRLIRTLAYLCRSLLTQYKTGSSELSKTINTTNKEGVKTSVNITQKLSNVANGLHQTVSEDLKDYIKKTRSIISKVQTKTAPKEWSEINDTLIELEDSLLENDRWYFPKNAHLINRNK
jgi:hypothetical protein